MNYSFRSAFAACSLLLSTPGFAQEKPFVESADISSGENQYGFFGEDETFVYSSRMSGFGGQHHLFIDKVDKNTLKTVTTTELKQYSELQKGTRPTFDLHGFLVKDKVYCFYEYFDNKKDTMYLILQTIAGDGKVSEPYNVLKTSTRNSYMSSIIVFSPDRESFVTMANPASMYVNMWDPFDKFYVELKPCLYKSATLEKVWERNITTYVKARCYAVSDIAIDNTQNLYFTYKEKDEAATGVYIITASSPVIKQVPDLISQYLRTEGTSLAIGKNGDLLFSGVYADQTKDGRGFYGDPGFFLRVLNTENLELKLSKDYQFSVDVMNKLSMGEITKKQNSDQKKYNLHPSNLFSRFQLQEAADAYYFLTEDCFDEVFYGKHNKDIIVMKALKNGDMKYTSVIPHYNHVRYTKVETQGFLINDRLCVLTGENPELVAAKMPEYESLMMPRMDDCFGNVIVVNVSDNGELNKRTLFLNKKHELIYSYPYSPLPVIYGSNKLMFTLTNTKANLIRYAAYKID